MELTKILRFSAAHRLASAAFSPAENRRQYGACARTHGHNYALEATVRGVVDAEGMVMDAAALEQAMRTAVVDLVDHREVRLVDEQEAQSGAREDTAVPYPFNTAEELVRLATDQRLCRYDVAAVVYNRTARLEGKVSDEADRRRAEKLALEAGALRVDDRLLLDPATGDAGRC